MAERQQQRGAAPTRPAAWELEFEDAWEAEDQRAKLVADMAEHFSSPAGWADLAAGASPWHGRTVVELDWQALCATCPCPDLQPAVAAAPAVALSCIACAAYEVRRVLPRWVLPAGLPRCRCPCARLPAPTCPSDGRRRARPRPAAQVLFRLREAATRAQLPALQAPGRVLLRLRNTPAAFRTISSIKADCIGRLVSVRGTVVRATAPQPLVTSLEFVCGKCGAAQRVPFPDGRYTPPAGCAEHGCRSRTFMPLRPSAACIDWQRVALQVGGAGGCSGWPLLLVAGARPRAPPAAAAACRAAAPRPINTQKAAALPPSPPAQGLPKDERGYVGRVPVPIGVELTEDLVGAGLSFFLFHCFQTARCWLPALGCCHHWRCCPCVYLQHGASMLLPAPAAPCCPMPCRCATWQVGSCAPGDVATVVGIVKVQTGEAAGGKPNELERSIKGWVGLHERRAVCAVCPSRAAPARAPMQERSIPPCHHLPACCTVPRFSPGKKGGGGGKPKDQCLFLPYIQARCAAGAAALAHGYSCIAPRPWHVLFLHSPVESALHQPC